MSKTVQIPYTLFTALLRYHLTDEPDPDGDLQQEIEDGLSQKLNAVIRHELYTAYKSASDPAEREAARLKYLDEAGISSRWRWKQGYQP